MLSMTPSHTSFFENKEERKLTQSRLKELAIVASFIDKEISDVAIQYNNTTTTAVMIKRKRCHDNECKDNVDTTLCGAMQTCQMNKITKKKKKSV